MQRLANWAASHLTIARIPMGAVPNERAVQENGRAGEISGKEKEGLFGARHSCRGEEGGEGFSLRRLPLVFTEDREGPCHR